MKKLYYIYLTQNLLDKKRYVGLHVTKYEDDGYCGSGVYLKNAIKKHGRDNFITGIVEYCDKRNIFNREIYWIKKLDTLYPNGYNLSNGGEGSDRHEFTNEQKLKISKTIRDKNILKRENIIILYKEGKTYNEIQKILKCSCKTISKTLKDNNIKGRNWIDYREPKLTEETKNKLSVINLKKSENKWNDIKCLYIKGHTTKEICNILHCGPNTITKVIKKFNLSKK